MIQKYCHDFTLTKIANNFVGVFWHPKVPNSNNFLQKLFHPRCISPIHFYIPPTMFSFLWRQCAVIFFSLSKFISFFNVRLYKTCPCLIFIRLSKFYQDFIQTKFGINLNKRIALIIILSSLYLVKIWFRIKKTFWINPFYAKVWIN